MNLQRREWLEFFGIIAAAAGLIWLASPDLLGQIAFGVFLVAGGALGLLALSVVVGGVGWLVGLPFRKKGPK